MTVTTIHTTVQNDHEEKETLAVDVLIPGHAPRVTTPLFVHSRTDALLRDGGRCFVCERTEAEVGAPHELHHWLIERSLEEAADWQQFRQMVFKLEALIGYAADYARDHPDLPDPMTFVDDMRVNGMTLCKEHHTAVGTGVHTLPMPIWLLQAYAKPGYQFTAAEAIIHDAIAPIPTVSVPTETIPLPAGVHVGDTETSLPLPDGRTIKTIKHADGSLTQEFYGADGKLQFPVTATKTDRTPEVASS